MWLRLFSGLCLVVSVGFSILDFIDRHQGNPTSSEHSGFIFPLLMIGLGLALVDVEIVRIWRRLDAPNNNKRSESGPEAQG